MERTRFKSVLVALAIAAVVACGADAPNGLFCGPDTPCTCSSNGQHVAQASDCPAVHGSETHQTSGGDITASIGPAQVSGSAWGAGALNTNGQLSPFFFLLSNDQVSGKNNQFRLSCMGTTAGALNAAHTLKDACRGGASLTISSDQLNATATQDLTLVPTSLSAQADIDASGNGTLSIRIDVPQFMAATSLQDSGLPATMLISISDLEAMVTFGDRPDTCIPSIWCGSWSG